MKPLLIVANLKSNLTRVEAKKWIEGISKFKAQISNFSNKKVIVCPSFTLLQAFRDLISEYKLQIYLGAQNISHLPIGPYTGEVNGSQIKDFADYVIVGHSERRALGEDESVVEEKIKMSIDYNLNPILCVQNINNKIPQGVSIVAYEPIFAIGTGNPDTPEDAENISKKIKDNSKASVLYGGSVSPDNVRRFTEKEHIDGVLVGNESLDPFEFFKVVENA